MRAIALLLMFIACLAPSPCPAAGFDCAKAASATEKAICADPDLSALDGRLAEAFRAALAAAPDKSALRDAQKAWLKGRDACGDAACLRKAYDARLAALAGTASPAEPAEPAKPAKPAKPAVEPGQAKAELAKLLERRAELYARLKWPAECEQEYRERFADADAGASEAEAMAGSPAAGVEIHPLGAGKSLAIVECGRFAYQIGFAAVVFDESGQTPPVTQNLRQYDRETSGKVTIIDTDQPAGLPVYNPANQTLTVLAKARGIGDCGAYVTYSFASGRAEVVQARAQACFDDKRKWIADPAKWPKVEKP